MYRQNWRRFVNLCILAVIFDILMRRLHFKINMLDVYRGRSTLYLSSINNFIFNFFDLKKDEDFNIPAFKNNMLKRYAFHLEHDLRAFLTFSYRFHQLAYVAVDHLYQIRNTLVRIGFRMHLLASIRYLQRLVA